VEEEHKIDVGMNHGKNSRILGNTNELGIGKTN
jgi:hypothetical protein